ncbi:MAG: glycosyltransferase family 9 protein [Nitrospirota bacterium]
MRKLHQKTKNFAIKTVINLIKQMNLVDINYCAVPSKFLVISTTGIGDTLWGTPAIRALKETYPECYIGVLTNPAGFELLRENPNIDGLFIFRRGLKGILSLPILLRALRQKRFEIVFIFHASDRIIWPISFLTGAAEIIGIEGQNKGLDFVLTRRLAPQNNIHGIEARLNLINLIGAETSNKSISIYLTEKDRETAERFLRDNGITQDTLLVGLHPAAQKPFKCWPQENFITLGNTLTERFKCRIIITGDSGEKALADMVSLKINDSITFAGKLTIRETAALIERLNIFITNDTGPMHIAFALKTPTIALFCPTDPKLCGPYHTERVVIIEKPKTCNPCIGKKCDTPRCMEQIKVEEVLESVKSLLNSKIRDNIK